MWVLSYVFSIFCTCITSFGDFTRPQHQKTTMRTYARYTIYNLEIWDVSFPQSFEFPGTNYPRCQRCLSFLISVFFFLCARVISSQVFENRPLEPGWKKDELEEGKPKTSKTQNLLALRGSNWKNFAKWRAKLTKCIISRQTSNWIHSRLRVFMTVGTDFKGKVRLFLSQNENENVSFFWNHSSVVFFSLQLLSSTKS